MATSRKHGGIVVEHIGPEIKINSPEYWLIPRKQHEKPGRKLVRALLQSKQDGILTFLQSCEMYETGH